MQAEIVSLIRELMQTQQLSIRKISALIAKEHGGSALGYTQQIHRILNDPDYEPSFSTVQKILSALQYSFWQIADTTPSHSPCTVQLLAARLDHLSTEMAELKSMVAHLLARNPALTLEAPLRSMVDFTQISGDSHG